jgi:hypothetical protein
LKSILWVAAGTITGLPRESLGLKQSRRESAVRGKPIKFQSESITADLCLGVAIAGINTLIGADYRVRVSGPRVGRCSWLLTSRSPERHIRKTRGVADDHLSGGDTPLTGYRRYFHHGDVFGTAQRLVSGTYEQSASATGVLFPEEHQRGF